MPPVDTGLTTKSSHHGKNNKPQFTHIKVKDIKKYMFEVYTEELFRMINMDEFVKNEIESKAIVVIDEIDKLVRSVRNSLLIIMLWIA